MTGLSSSPSTPELSSSLLSFSVTPWISPELLQRAVGYVSLWSSNFRGLSVLEAWEDPLSSSSSSSGVGGSRHPGNRTAATSASASSLSTDFPIHRGMPSCTVLPKREYASYRQVLEALHDSHHNNSGGGGGDESAFLFSSRSCREVLEERFGPSRGSALFREVVIHPVQVVEDAVSKLVQGITMAYLIPQYGGAEEDGSYSSPAEEESEAAPRSFHRKRKSLSIHDLDIHVQWVPQHPTRFYGGATVLCTSSSANTSNSNTVTATTVPLAAVITVRFRPQLIRREKALRMAEWALVGRPTAGQHSSALSSSPSPLHGGGGTGGTSSLQEALAFWAAVHESPPPPLPPLPPLLPLLPPPPPYSSFMKETCSIFFGNQASPGPTTTTTSATSPSSSAPSSLSVPFSSSASSLLEQLHHLPIWHPPITRRVRRAAWEDLTSGCHHHHVDCDDRDPPYDYSPPLSSSPMKREASTRMTREVLGKIGAKRKRNEEEQQQYEEEEEDEMILSSSFVHTPIITSLPLDMETVWGGGGGETPRTSTTTGVGTSASMNEKEMARARWRMVKAWRRRLTTTTTSSSSSISFSSFSRSSPSAVRIPEGWKRSRGKKKSEMLKAIGEENKKEEHEHHSADATNELVERRNPRRQTQEQDETNNTVKKNTPDEIGEEEEEEKEDEEEEEDTAALLTQPPTVLGSWRSVEELQIVALEKEQERIWNALGNHRHLPSHNKNGDFHSNQTEGEEGGDLADDDDNEGEEQEGRKRISGGGSFRGGKGNASSRVTTTSPMIIIDEEKSKRNMRVMNVLLSQLQRKWEARVGHFRFYIPAKIKNNRHHNLLQQRQQQGGGEAEETGVEEEVRASFLFPPSLSFFFSSDPLRRTLDTPTAVWAQPDKVGVWDFTSALTNGSAVESGRGGCGGTSGAVSEKGGGWWWWEDGIRRSSPPPSLSTLPYPPPPSPPSSSSPCTAAITRRGAGTSWTVYDVPRLAAAPGETSASRSRSRRGGGGGGGEERRRSERSSPLSRCGLIAYLTVALDGTVFVGYPLPPPPPSLLLSRQSNNNKNNTVIMASSSGGGAQDHNDVHHHVEEEKRQREENEKKQLRKKQGNEMVAVEGVMMDTEGRGGSSTSLLRTRMTSTATPTRLPLEDAQSFTRGLLRLS